MFLFQLCNQSNNEKSLHLHLDTENLALFILRLSLQTPGDLRDEFMIGKGAQPKS